MEEIHYIHSVNYFKDALATFMNNASSIETIFFVKKIQL